MNFDVSASPLAHVWLAVLHQAIEDARCASKPRLQQDAVRWFNSASEKPQSFRWLARAVLGRDPAKVYAAIFAEQPLALAA